MLRLIKQKFINLIELELVRTFELLILKMVFKVNPSRMQKPNFNL